jgi:phosphoribosyl 1,2-cyclic phosphodiesterase
MIEIIASGSTGNAVLYNKTILIDCGVPFKKIEPYLGTIQIVLYSHIHGDHLNIKTLKRMQFEKPSLRVGCGNFLVQNLEGINNIDIFEAGKVYDYCSFQISPIILFHDVEIFGYRLFVDGEKIIHATDTEHLEGITAKSYDYFCLESNYDEETIIDRINEKKMRGEFAHEIGSINSHLSFQQCNDFFYKNKGVNSQLIRLHESKSV